jgi:hypothetical protein
MPRYYFHTSRDGKIAPDTEGVHLDGADQAHSEAMAATGEIIKDVDGHFKNGQWSMRVVDEAGSTVSEIDISVNKKT